MEIFRHLFGILVGPQANYDLNTASDPLRKRIEMEVKVFGLHAGGGYFDGILKAAL